MMKCYSCFSTELKNAVYLERPSVTSDERIFDSPVEILQCQECGHLMKDPDRNKIELIEIYQSYFSQEQHFEPVWIGSDKDREILSRNEVLVRAMAERVTLSEEGKLLDIGCNVGHMMRAFSKCFPKWQIFGHDLENPNSQMMRVCFGNHYFTEPLESIKERFNVITMTHVLEHIPDPVIFLEKASQCLARDGYLLVEVPYYCDQAVDLLVFDHVSHFSPETLVQTATNAGLKVIFSSTRVFPKEITVIAKKITNKTREVPNHSHSVSSRKEVLFGQYGCRGVHKNLDEVLSYLRKFRELCESVRNLEQLGVFGAAVQGTWAYGLLKGNIQYFVDESPLKIGKSIFNKMINAPQNLTGGNVVLALAPIWAKAVALRYRSAPFKMHYL